MTTRWTITMDCHSPTLVAEFWKTALGYVDASPPAGFGSWEAWQRHHQVPEEEWDDGAFIVDPEGALPSISMMKVPESKIAKNRVHLDVQAGGGRETVPHQQRWARVEAEVDRLLAAGATKINLVAEPDGRPDHVLMGDPEGNEFCVL
jgi:hypothetical protein